MKLRTGGYILFGAGIVLSLIPASAVANPFTVRANHTSNGANLTTTTSGRSGSGGEALPLSNSGGAGAASGNGATSYSDTGSSSAATTDQVTIPTDPNAPINNAKGACNSKLPLTAQGQTALNQACTPATTTGGATAAPAPPNPQVLAQTAVLSLTLPAPAPSVGPPPSINQWHSAFVGYPLWLWTKDAGTLTKTMTVQGYPVTLAAHRDNVIFSMGDGNTVTCTTATAWNASVPPATPSPDCGYTYQARGQYTITANAAWTITWSALGQTGTIPMTRTATLALPVGELQSVNTTADGGQ